MYLIYSRMIIENIIYLCKEPNKEKVMKRVFIFMVSLLVLGTLARVNAQEKETLVKVGDDVPEFVVEMFDGQKINIKDLKGKIVLINFWATWCPPCQEELKRVQKEIIDRFKGKDFVFLAISREESKEQVKKFRERNGYTFPMGLDPERKIYSKFATATIPRNFIIDKKGKIVEIEVGYTKEAFSKMIEKLERLLK
jgi:peroxiredoxin|nr:TlpA disulfide reductase family protein [Butyricimonas faecihominis]